MPKKTHPLPLVWDVPVKETEMLGSYYHRWDNNDVKGANEKLDALNYSHTMSYFKELNLKFFKMEKEKDRHGK